ncbi:MAG: FAD-dependent monooxygenase [Acidimicrobiaceae bacterium]|nr:FAD-dependent monooxygenase [Acidimicrobiaceae bacterium]
MAGEDTQDSEAGSAADRFEVVIVGGGPVGVALAVELGQRGVRCVVVERHHEVGHIPKGQNLTQRSLEHFYFWGCVDRLRAARLLPPGYPIGGVTAYRSLFSPYWYAPAGLEQVRSFYFQDNDRLPQYLTEEVLRTRLTELDSATTLFGWTATRIEQDAHGVRVSVTGGPGRSESRVIEADYLVGCDGARSLVREHLGIKLEGPNFNQKMVLAVFRSREFHEGLRRFPERTTYRVLKPELRGVWQFFGRVDVGETFFFHAPVPRETTEEDGEAITALIDEVAGFPTHAKLDHLGFWELRVEVAATYRQGRAFIAGDAAHSHPPYGGFGLNTGLEDVTNLGWKLAGALRGWGGDGLLDSYSQERQPVFWETGVAYIAGGIQRDDEFLQRYRPEHDLPEFEAAWGKRTTGDAAGPAYEPNYGGSPVVFGSEGATSGVSGGHTFAAQAGHHLAPLVLSSGRNVYEELGSDFTLIALGADPAVVEGFEASARAQGVPLKVLTDSREGDRQEFRAGLVLVRPDQFVAWAGDQEPSDIEALFRRVTGTR